MGGKVGQSFRYFFTGKYEGNNGNNTINAFGFGGKIYAKGGNDTIRVGSIAATVYTGTGNDRVYGAAGKLTVRDETGELRVYGGSGYADIAKSGSGNLIYGGASGATSINHYGWSGNITFSGASFYNRIRRTGYSGSTYFRGAGVGNNIQHRTQYGNLSFVGAGARNFVKRDWYRDYNRSYGNVSFSGGGASNHVENWVKHGHITFYGSGFSNYVKRQGGRGGSSSGNVSFYGSGASNRIYHITQNGNTSFSGGGAYNYIKRDWQGNYHASSGNVTFNGAGVYNKIESWVKHGNVTFRGAGGGNYIKRQGGLGSSSSGNVYFSGAGASNKIYHITQTGSTYFSGAGAYNYIKRDWQGDYNNSRGTVSMNGAGAYNKIEHLLKHGDLIFQGAGGYNNLKRYGRNGGTSSGNVTFNGGGAGNKISHGTYSGTTYFNGAGAANIITRYGSYGSSGDVRFNGAGAANVITHSTTYGNTYFNGAGGANVIKRSGTWGDVVFRGAGVANVITHTTAYGNTDFAGAGGANVITRSGFSGNVKFAGGGAANIVTHTSTHGNTDFAGGGGANVITRTGQSGNVIFRGAGAANVITHLTDTGDTLFQGAGAGNVVTRTGKQGDVTFDGAGLGNIITQTTAQGDLDVLALGGHNVVTKTGNGHANLEMGGGSNTATVLGGGTVDAIMIGGLNTLTTNVDGKTTATMAGAGNIATVIGGQADITALGGANVINTGTFDDKIRSYGVANVINSAGGNNDIQVFGAYSVVIDGGETSHGAGQVSSAASEADTPTPFDGITSAFKSFSQDGVETLTGGDTGGLGLLDPILSPLGLGESLEADEGDNGDGLSEADMAALEEQNIDLDERLAAQGRSRADLENNPSGEVPDDIESQDAAAVLEAAKNENAANYQGLTSGAGDVPDMEAFAAQNSEAMALAETDGDTHRRTMEARAQSDTTAQDVNPDDVDGDDKRSTFWAGAGIGHEFEGFGEDNVVVAYGAYNYIETDNLRDLVFSLGLAGNYIATGAGNDGVLAVGAVNAIRTGDGNDWAVMLGLANYFEGGDGNDVAVMAGAANIARMGGGDEDFVFQLGVGNYAGKEEDGNLYAVMGGLGNLLYHGAYQGGDDANVTGDLVAIMGGGLNVAHKQGDGYAVGVLLGYVNSFSHKGEGEFVAVLGGRLNVATKVGDGTTVMVMLGQLNVATQVGDGFSTFIMGGQMNVATKVGDNTSVLVMLGNLNVATVVGDGDLYGLFLGKLNAVTKVGGGRVGVAMAGQGNALTVVNAYQESDLFGVLAGKANIITKVGDGGAYVISAGSLGNVMTQVGKGNLVSILLGKANVTTKVGDTGDYGDGFAVMIGVGTANISTHVGDGFTFMGGLGRANITTKAGDGPLGVVLIGQANVTVHVGDGTFAGLMASYSTEKSNPTAKYTDKVSELVSSTPDKFFKSISLDSLPDKQKWNHALDDMWGLIGLGGELSPFNIPSGNSGQQTDTVAGSQGSDDVTDMAAEAVSAITGGNWKKQLMDAAVSASANIAVKVGDGDIGFLQVSKKKTKIESATGGSEDGSDQVTSGEAGQAILNYSPDVHELLQNFSFNNRLNVLVQVGNGKLFNAQVGDANFVVKVGNGHGDWNLDWDVFNFASGDFNVAVEVNTDSLFAGGSIFGVAENIQYPRADHSTRSMQVMMGHYNTAFKVGDGMSIRAMHGSGNVAVKAGHGNDISVMIGDGNLSLRVGSADPNLGEHSEDWGWFDGAKVMMGRYNVAIDIGKSNDVYMTYARDEDSKLTDLVSKTLGYASNSFQFDWVSGQGVPLPNIGQLTSLTAFGFSLPFLSETKEGSSTSYTTNQGKRQAKSQIPTTFNKLTNLRKDFTNGFYSFGHMFGLTKKGNSIPFSSGADESIESGQEIIEHFQLMNLGMIGAFAEGGNVIHAGGGSDVIVSVGPGNLVFGDYVTSAVDLSLAAFMPAMGQAISLNEFIGMWSGSTDIDGNAHQNSGRMSQMANAFAGMISYFQTFGDIGGTVPYESFGTILGVTYDENGVASQNFDQDQFFAYFVRIFWAEATLPSSIFGGALLNGIATEIGGADWANGFLDLSSSLMNGGTEDGSAVDDFATNTDAVTNAPKGFFLPENGYPVIPAVPNVSSLIHLASNFAEIAAVDNGGSVDNLKKFFTSLKPLEGDGDMMIALGDANLQFGGHGDDIMASIGLLGKLMGGEGNDMLFSLGEYSYLTGNQGDDFMVALGQYNVIHDIDGNNSVIAIGEKNDIRMGRGNDFLVVYGDKTKARMGDGFNFGVVLGNKNSIYLGGENIIFGIGGENNYYVLGGTDAKSLIYNLGAATVTFSPGAKGYAEVDGGKIVGNDGDDYIAFGRASTGGDLFGDDRLNQVGLDNRSRDTIMMRGENTIAWGGNGGSDDKDHFIVGYGLKGGRIQEAGGSKLGFGDETEDKVVLGERVGMADYSETVQNAPIRFEKIGDDLKIFMPDHVIFEDGTAPLGADRLNTVIIEDYFAYGGDRSAQIVLSVWDQNFSNTVLNEWLAEHASSEAAAQAKRDAGNQNAEAIHTFSTHSFSNYSYLTKSGVEALIAAYNNSTAATDEAKWAEAWANEWASVVKQGEGLGDFKLAQNKGLMLAGDGADNIIDGTVEGDTLEGLAGADTLNGGLGNDTLLGGAGDDNLDGGDGIDTAHFGDIDAAVIVDLSIGTATTVNGAGTTETDTLTNIENVTGTGFDDTLSGDVAANALKGMAGNDLLEGGAGEDELYGGKGDDTLLGGIDNDWLEGGEGADLLDGGAGDDELLGGESNDVLLGGVGNDWLDGGAGTDRLDGGAGSDTYNISAGDEHTVIADTGTDAADEDTVIFADSDHTGLWFSQQNDDLLIELLGGANETVTVEGWYSAGATNDTRIDMFVAGDHELDQASVQQLVDAMAVWDASNSASGDRQDALSNDNNLINALAAWAGPAAA